jgi:hypothetical protein
MGQTSGFLGKVDQGWDAFASTAILAACNRRRPGVRTLVGRKGLGFCGGRVCR